MPRPEEIGSGRARGAQQQTRTAAGPPGSRSGPYSQRRARPERIHHTPGTSSNAFERRPAYSGSSDWRRRRPPPLAASLARAAAVTRLGACALAAAAPRGAQGLRRPRGWGVKLGRRRRLRVPLSPRCPGPSAGALQGRWWRRCLCAPVA